MTARPSPWRSQLPLVIAFWAACAIAFLTDSSVVCALALCVALLVFAVVAAQITKR